MQRDDRCPSRPRGCVRAASLSVLALLAGACGDDKAGDSSAAGTYPGGSSASDSGGGTDGSGGSDGSGGWDPSGEPPPDDSGQAGTTDDDTGTTGDSSTGEPAPVCDVETPVVLYLSPDDSNSTSSPVQAREAVLNGFGSLTYVPIRPWEFLNYYSFAYAPAQPGQIRVVPEIAAVADGEAGQFALQIGVVSPAIPAADRALMNVTLVLDESGSMSGAPMDMQREVCRTIAANLREGDVVSMVGWDTENAIKLAGHVVTAASDPVVVGECDRLEIGGGTNLHGGLEAGYALAHEHYSAGRLNRVVLVSDGGANAGVTDIDIIAGGAGDEDGDGIYLVGVGVGTFDSYNDALMDVVTDVGKGASLFVPSADEAHKMFGERFVATMMVAARDVRVRLDMPPGFEIVRFSGEEYSADPTQVEPQHLAPNDAMVFHQTVQTCAPELAAAGAEFTVTARYLDAVSFEAREVSETRVLSEALAEASPQLRKGAAVFAYAEALKAWRDGGGQAAALDPAFAALSAAEAVLADDPDLKEIRQVLEAVQAM